MTPLLPNAFSLLDMFEARVGGALAAAGARMNKRSSHVAEGARQRDIEDVTGAPSARSYAPATLAAAPPV